MNKLVILVLIIILIAGGIYYWQNQEEEKSELPNPAAVYCEEQNGTLASIVFESGTRGFCLFADGSQCGQWDFYREDCHKGELKIEILKAGTTGQRAEDGHTVIVHYTGTLTDGTKFDSSLDKGQPFSFILGEGEVIPGWEQGVLGMQVGEKRKLTIAPELAYGEMGIPGVIPAQAILIFTVELLEIR